MAATPRERPEAQAGLSQTAQEPSLPPVAQAAAAPLVPTAGAAEVAALLDATGPERMAALHLAWEVAAAEAAEAVGQTADHLALVPHPAPAVPALLEASDRATTQVVLAPPL